MTRAEMNRRLAELTSKEILDIEALIAEGNGAAGIAGASQGEYFKQVNAVFKWMELKKAGKPLPIRDASTGEIECYEYRGQYIYRDDTARNRGRWEVSEPFGGTRFPTLKEAAAYIDSST